MRAKLAEREARTQESWAGLALVGTEYPHVMRARRHRAEARGYRNDVVVIDDLLVKLSELEGKGVAVVDEFLRWASSDTEGNDLEASVLDELAFHLLRVDLLGYWLEE